MAGIYIHIPFCKQKCHYCNFFSVATLKNKEALIKSILQEIENRKDYLGNEEVKTIYFGGGTPSLLEIEELNLIFEQLHKHFKICKDAEITLEANPDDLNRTYLEQIKNSPINRFSIGIQSFHNDDLKYLNRIHSGEDALNSIKLAQDYGFENLTIDLIYGIPGLTMDKWKRNLELFYSLNIPHLSAYSLTVEPKTALDTLIRKKKLPNVKDEESIAHFKFLQKSVKENGYEHYEISNFSKPGYYSKHNSLYWLGAHYLGLGPSAHSFNGTSRQWNVSSLSRYIQGCEKNDPVFEKEILSKDQQFNEYIMTSLRTSWGCSLEHIQNIFGKQYLKKLELNISPFIKKEWVTLNSKTYFLTESGKLFADGIASDLFIDD
ncbi:MAG: coproporphyrinogen III oxidase [Bacteroidetes bacterium]|nr:coproporphyrinogen III oxidase [Bacteroidota bacterium]